MNPAPLHVSRWDMDQTGFHTMITTVQAPNGFTRPNHSKRSPPLASLCAVGGSGNVTYVFTNLILSHLLQFVHSELLLLQAVQHNVTQVGELAERVGKAPQPLVNHLTQGEKSVGHGRPPLPQSNLKQRPDDSSSILERSRRGGGKSESMSELHKYKLIYRHVISAFPRHQ